MPRNQAPKRKPRKNKEPPGGRESSALKPEPRVEVDDVELKTVEMRLRGIKEATQRSRFVFLVLTILASAIFISAWNGALSWERGLAEKVRKAEMQEPEKEPETTPVASAWQPNKTNLQGLEKAQAGKGVNPFRHQSNKAQLPENEEPALSGLYGMALSGKPFIGNDSSTKSVVTEWAKGLGISVGLLGTRVSGNDLSLIGSISLIIVMTWYFYSQRRENRAIVSLLKDCHKDYKLKQVSEYVCRMVFMGVVHSLVFIDLGKGDEPLEGLETEEDKKQEAKPNKSAAIRYYAKYYFGRIKHYVKPLFEQLRRLRFWRKDAVKRDEVGGEKTFLIRGVVRALVYLAPMTIIWIVLTDAYTLSQPSPIRHPNLPLWATLDGFETGRVMLFEPMALLSALYSGYLCRKSTRFSRATANTLKAYQEFLDELPGEGATRDS